MSSARRRSGLAVATAFSVALLSIVVVRPLRAQSADEVVGSRLDLLTRDMTAGLRELEELREEVGRLSDGILQVAGRLAGVRAQTVVAGRSVRDGDEDLRVGKRQLEHRTRAAEEGIATGGRGPLPARPADLADLSAPLEAVSAAIHAGDELMVEVLEQQAETRRQEAALDRSLAELRAAAFLLAGLERELQAKVVAARQLEQRLEADGAGSGVNGPASGARELVANAVTRLHELETRQLELRRVEGELLSARVLLTERQRMLVGEIGAARRMIDALYEDMAAAEALVATWLPTLRSPSAGAREGAVEGILQVCPVDEPHAYTDDFGAPRWAGGFHLHQGNDVFAPPGTPIRAPFSGIAVDAANALGGNAVVVYGRTGYVYNAHLSAYGTLGRVTVGTIIGYVGNTGDARNTAPHDHFEWHPGNGPAVDPFPYLNAVC